MASKDIFYYEKNRLPENEFLIDDMHVGAQVRAKPQLERIKFQEYGDVIGSNAHEIIYNKHSVSKGVILLNGSLYPPVFVPKFGDICLVDAQCHAYSWCENYNCECFDGYFRLSQRYECISKSRLMTYAFYFSVSVFVVLVIIAIPLMTMRYRLVVRNAPALIRDMKQQCNKQSEMKARYEHEQIHKEVSSSRHV